MEAVKIEENKTVLAICETTAKSEIEEFLKNIPNKTILSLEELSGIEENTPDVIFIQLPEETLNESLLQKVFKKIKAGAQLIISKLAKNADNVEFLLKTTGFINVEVKKSDTDSYIVSSKPKYEIGSSAKLNLKKPAAAVWKLDDEEDDEFIDPDNLLDEEDLKKPDPSSLRVCGTTGKRKACKDCSCGLADELASEAQSGKVVDTTNAPKSSCGNCYLGDAFRCASCPYVGMPAFKPGEKIQLSDNLLKADV